MSGFLGLIPGEWWGYIISAATGAAVMIATWFGGRRSAKTAQKLDALEDKADALETRNEIDNRVARERDARDKLRTDWGQ